MESCKKSLAFMVVLALLITALVPAGVLAEGEASADSQDVFWDTKNAWGPSYYFIGSTVTPLRSSSDSGFFPDSGPGQPGHANRVIQTKLDLDPTDEPEEPSTFSWTWNDGDPVSYSGGSAAGQEWWEAAAEAHAPFTSTTANSNGLINSGKNEKTDSTLANIWTQIALNPAMTKDWTTESVYYPTCRMDYTGTTPKAGEPNYQTAPGGPIHMLKPVQIATLSNNPSLYLGEPPAAGTDMLDPRNTGYLLSGYVQPTEQYSYTNDWSAKSYAYYRPLMWQGTLTADNSSSLEKAKVEHEQLKAPYIASIGTKDVKSNLSEADSPKLAFVDARAKDIVAVLPGRVDGDVTWTWKMDGKVVSSVDGNALPYDVWSQAPASGAERTWTCTASVDGKEIGSTSVRIDTPPTVKTSNTVLSFTIGTSEKKEASFDSNGINVAEAEWKWSTETDFPAGEQIFDIGELKDSTYSVKIKDSYTPDFVTPEEGHHYTLTGLDADKNELLVDVNLKVSANTLTSTPSELSFRKDDTATSKEVRFGWPEGAKVPEGIEYKFSAPSNTGLEATVDETGTLTLTPSSGSNGWPIVSGATFTVNAVKNSGVLASGTVTVNITDPQVTSYSLTYSEPKEGCREMVVSSGGASIKSGENVPVSEKVEVQITPEEDYQVREVKAIYGTSDAAVEVSKESDNRWTFTMPNGRTTLTVSMAKSSAAPQISLEADKTTVTAGDAVQVEAALTGWMQTPEISWSASGGGITGPESISEDKLTATFVPTEAGDLTVTATAQGNDQKAATDTLIIRVQAQSTPTQPTNPSTPATPSNPTDPSNPSQPTASPSQPATPTSGISTPTARPTGDPQYTYKPEINTAPSSSAAPTSSVTAGHPTGTTPTSSPGSDPIVPVPDSPVHVEIETDPAVDGEMLVGIPVSTNKDNYSVAFLGAYVATPNGTHIEVVSASGQPIDNEYEPLATGQIARVVDRSGNVLSEYKVVVKGDVTGAGRMSIAQLTRLAGCITGRSPLTDVYHKAGDLSNDGRINIVDLVQMAEMLLNS